MSIAYRLQKQPKPLKNCEDMCKSSPHWTGTSQEPQSSTRRLCSPSALIGNLSLSIFFFLLLLSNSPMSLAFSSRSLPLSRPSKVVIPSSFSHVPKTQTVSQSIRSFARYCLRSTRKRIKKRKSTKELQPGQLHQNIDGFSNDGHLDTEKTWFSKMKHWNEQRKYVVQLANYKSHIVVPSFSALIIGALMVSLVPHFEARCIQMVATLHESQAEVIYAILGLVVTNTLAAILTGVRGALFWIAGSRANFNIRVKLHERLLYVCLLRMGTLVLTHDRIDTKKRPFSTVTKLGVCCRD